MRQTKGMVSIQEDVTPEGCAECSLSRHSRAHGRSLQGLED
jgi:hypothetical protein